MIYLCDKSQILTMTIVFEFEYLFSHIEPLQEMAKCYFNIFHKPLSYSNEYFPCQFSPVVLRSVQFCFSQAVLTSRIKGIR